jgi:hypothetical protein
MAKLSKIHAGSYRLDMPRITFEIVNILRDLPGVKFWVWRFVDVHGDEDGGHDTYPTRKAAVEAAEHYHDVDFPTIYSKDKAPTA